MSKCGLPGSPNNTVIFCIVTVLITIIATYFGYVAGKEKQKSESNHLQKSNNVTRLN
ncbi:MULTISPECIES: hypothetical protein [unclassified Nodularia (in: cyanobacteria)]|uniref:hypothetical protein n=1 Tax=unclassified Nodularia (in: cyanobacteria) TaxID=2656917 RepID=UPI001881487A|nr:MULTISPECIES: hypothetical protein [unclassified Nodularia (in: cyanobacteria)]MBE9197502.1 hypothetical protein [Nodularia sp. LEGE 06071]MCC2694385.1 hypothetical protein [Nodularia sp. LEGE 04288]